MEALKCMIDKYLSTAVKVYLILMWGKGKLGYFNRHFPG